MTILHDLHTPRPVAIDLFAGAGGLSLGLEMAGFDVVSAVEYDPVHAATHLFNFPQTDMLCRDVSRITGADLRSSAEKGWRALHGDAPRWNGDVDLIAGGPSCQGFSVMGRRDADDERNLLIQQFVRLVLEVKPRAFILENVPGILAPQFRSILQQATDTLRRGGYDLNDYYQPLSATDFGVPQRRKRVFIVGVLDGVAPKHPRATVFSETPVQEALAGLPAILEQLVTNGDEATLQAEEWDTYESASNSYLDMLQAIPSRARDEILNTSRTLSGYLATQHKAASVARFELVPHGGTEPVSRAWRLSNQAPSRTLRAGTGRERGAFSASRPLHPTEARVITVREAARLHSFPDWFRFHATNWHAHRQIGNSVPPLLAGAVASAIIGTLGARPGMQHSRQHGNGPLSLLSLNPTLAGRLFDVSASEVPVPRTRVESVARAPQ